MSLSVYFRRQQMEYSILYNSCGILCVVAVAKLNQVQDGKRGMNVRSLSCLRLTLSLTQLACVWPGCSVECSVGRSRQAIAWLQPQGLVLCLWLVTNVSARAWTSRDIHRVPSGPTFPTFSQFCPHLKKIPTFLGNPSLKDGYGSILTKKCVIWRLKLETLLCSICQTWILFCPDSFFQYWTAESH